MLPVQFGSCLANPALLASRAQRLTHGRQSETLRRENDGGLGLNMRIMTATLAVVTLTFGSLSPGGAIAQTAPVAKRSTDISAQSDSSRPRVRIYRDDDTRGVYPRYNPGPNAVRDCTANLVQEYRPSGTVIVPRMNCYWRRG